MVNSSVTDSVFAGYYVIYSLGALAAAIANPEEDK